MYSPVILSLIPEAKQDSLTLTSLPRIQWTTAILKKMPDWLNVVTRADSHFLACSVLLYTKSLDKSRCEKSQCCELRKKVINVRLQK